MGDAVLAIEVLGDPAPFLAIVEADLQPSRADRTARGRGLRVPLPGRPRAARRPPRRAGPSRDPSRLLRPRKDNLEGLFLRVGAKALSSSLANGYVGRICTD
jgi:hypothetical protein